MHLLWWCSSAVLMWKLHAKIELYQILRIITCNLIVDISLIFHQYKKWKYWNGSWLFTKINFGMQFQNGRVATVSTSKMHKRAGTKIILEEKLSKNSQNCGFCWNCVFIFEFYHFTIASCLSNRLLISFGNRKWWKTAEFVCVGAVVLKRKQKVSLFG